MSTKVLPTSHILKQKDRREVAERTIGLCLEKPLNFNFDAGQFAELYLVDSKNAADDEQGLAFSMANAPKEDTLMFATRLRGGAFKQALATMPIASDIKVEGPFGKFVLHDDASRPAVVLACGIGITPVRSIDVHPAKAQLAHKILLFYSNRRAEDAAFLEELQFLESVNSNYQFFGVMTQMQKSQRSWTGLTSHINFERM